MDKILNCIDSYMDDLEKEVLKILSNKNSSMTNKNALIESLSEQKKVLKITKDALLNIQKKEYKGGCNMWQFRE